MSSRPRTSQPPSPGRSRSNGAVRALGPALLVLTVASCNGADRPAARGTVHAGPPAAATDRTVEGFVGSDACLICHSELARRYGSTNKGRSLVPFDARQAPERFDGSVVVVDTMSGLRYQAALRDGRLAQREFREDGDGRLLHDLEFAADLVIGSGNQTRSYLMVRNGRVTQMPLTWYSHRARWDLSPGYHEANDRFGRKIILECLQCHGDAPRRTPNTQNHYVSLPGPISCERCHGPGADHVRIAGAGAAAVPGAGDLRIVNPVRLDRERAPSVCAQCHMAGIMTYVPGHGAASFVPGMHLDEHRSVYVPEAQLTDPEWVGIDSHPVRLARSACFRESRMTCTTCHLPHTPDADLPRDHYAARCAACHAPGGGGESHACTRPVAGDGAAATAGDCVSCHMRSGGTSDVPHVRFTDHWIRREPGPPLPPEAGRPVIESPTPIRLVRLSPLGTAASAEAEGRLTESVRLAGEAEAYFRLWETMHRHGGYLPRVVQLGRRSLAAGAGTVEGRLALGRALLELDSVAEAEAVFRDLVSQAPADPWAHLFLGAILDERRGRPDAAVPHLERAVSLQPELLEARRKLAEALYSADRRREAAAQLEEIVRRDPIHEPRAWYNLGLVRAELGDAEAAAEAFRRASRLDPDLAHAHLAAGAADLDAGRVDAAERAFRAALAAAPADAAAHGGLALVHIRRGRMDLARERLTRVLELDPGNRQARALLDELDSIP